MTAKSLFYLLSCLLLTGCLLSCGSHSEVSPLTATLQTYTAQDADGEWTLRGVRETGTGSIVVSPDRYSRITADENFIVATKPENGMNVIWVYELDGKPVDWFDTFNHFKSDRDSVKMDYYYGTNYDQQFYYFPKTGVAIRTKESARFEPGKDYMLILDGNEWKAFTYDGISVSLPE